MRNALVYAKKKKSPTDKFREPNFAELLTTILASYSRCGSVTFHFG